MIVQDAIHGRRREHSIDGQKNHGDVSLAGDGLKSTAE